VRRRELADSAARCRWLAEHPARNFPDALQATWFLFVLLQMESNASSFSPGRLDQYLLPYLEADLSSGALDLSAAQEWLELLWLKFNEIVLLRSSASARYFAGFPIGFNAILGGQTRDGADATNLLSYMCLRAQADVGLTQPNLSIRIHRDSPQQFLRAASSVIGRGGGMPQVFNDEVIISGQIARGVDPDDARDYAVVGCVELSVPGKALGWSDASMFNLTRVLELDLFSGLTRRRTSRSAWRRRRWIRCPISPLEAPTTLLAPSSPDQAAPSWTAFTPVAAVAVPLACGQGLPGAGRGRDRGWRALQLLRRAGRAGGERGRQPGGGQAGGV
jgi:formate C-acetyltransferase